jgi:outer membrane lipoprotein-sorting protein
MKRFLLPTACLATLAAVPVYAGAAAAGTPSVAQIVEKNAAARGGLDAWHNVKTLTLEGTMDAGGKPAHELPFVAKYERPHKSRLEIVFMDQTSIQVFDGTQGWKVRPFLNRNEVESYTPTELKLARNADDFDGPLIDYQGKGTRLAVEGTEDVDGHPAYKLRLTSRHGTTRNLWIDAASYLEVKVDGEPRKLDGRMHKVELYYKDFRPEHGLNIAHLQETVVEGVKAEPYKLKITRVAVNDSLADAVFGKPQLPQVITAKAPERVTATDAITAAPVSPAASAATPRGPARRP